MGKEWPHPRAAAASIKTSMDRGCFFAAVPILNITWNKLWPVPPKPILHRDAQGCAKQTLIHPGCEAPPNDGCQQQDESPTSVARGRRVDESAREGTVPVRLYICSLTVDKGTGMRFSLAAGLAP